MMIISVATGIGLQQKIREKVAAFNGHIIISNYDDNQSKVSVEPISIQQTFYPTFKTVQGIDHIQAVASKAGIIRTENAFEGICCTNSPCFIIPILVATLTALKMSCVAMKMVRPSCPS